MTDRPSETPELSRAVGVGLDELLAVNATAPENWNEGICSC